MVLNGFSLIKNLAMKEFSHFSVKIFLSLSFIFIMKLSFAQISHYPCIEVPGPNLMITSEEDITPYRVNSSSNLEGNLQQFFNQNINDNDSIRVNGNPYSFIEIDLGTDAFINGIQFYYPDGVTNFNNFYVYFSDNSIRELSQSEIQNNEEFHHIHIATQYESGFLFDANFSARFITIINFNGSDILLSEIKIPGKKEICGNGFDDDCDGKVDCQDEDCWIRDRDYDVKIINQPSCPICCNGNIFLFSNSIKKVEFSIDGGLTWFTNPILDNLCVGNLNLKIRVNGGCNEVTKVIPLLAPPGNPTSPCDNGDFERGTFQGFTGDVGLRQNNSKKINWSNRGINPNNGIHFIWNVAGANVFPELDLPYLGNYSAELSVIGSYIEPAAARLDYDFTANQDLQSMCFAYALALNVKHWPEADAFFRYSIRDVITGATINTTTIVGDKSNTSYFIVKGNWVYRTWTCECIPIPQQYWGRPLRITFEISSCYFGEHHGSVFLDGLCEPKESFNPVACFSLDDCSYSNSLIVDGSCSKSETTYKWTICQTNQQNQDFDCKVVNGNNNAGTLNIANLFGNNFDCNRDLKVKLEVWNDCDGYSSNEEIYHLKCDNIEPAEKLILCVNTENQTQTILNPNIVCENCIYQWRDLNLSGIVFLNPTSPTPTVIVTAPNQYDVELKVIHQNGCITIKNYKIFATYVIFTYDPNEIVCDYANCQLNLFFDMQIVGGQNVALSNSQTIKHLASGNLYNFDIIEDIGTSGRRYHGTAVIDINDFGNYEWKPKFGNANSIGLESCSKTFNVTEFCYVQDYMPPVYAPTIVSPNSSNPENQQFFVQATTVDPDDPCTFYATHYILHIYDRWGDEIYIEDVLTSCDDAIPKRIYWNLHWGDDWTHAGVHTWVLERFNCTINKVDWGEFTVIF